MRKSHPIRRALLAGAATVSGIVLLLSLKPASDPASASAVGGAAPQQTAAAQSPQGGAQAAGTTTVTGEAVRTQYGPVQVRLTLSDGRVTKAEAVRAPSGGRSSQITAGAVPRLNEAAVAAGSAEIDAVSGATYTSTGYKQSLQSALDQAAAAGGDAGAGAGDQAGSEDAAGAGQGADAGQDAGAGQDAPEAPAQQARTVTGEVAQTQYGPVQVRVTVEGGRVTAAEAVQAPSGGRSSQITANAVPRLNQAAVAAGSAEIDAVSGATYTSAGYKQSLQSALDQAGGSGG
ncbi:FMN-binding protein [Streptomyces sp. NPDC001595]|uniref:FMN-binding protein n=1 Tax=Streptomyces sp. NPDC001532 TaxID=3154520 RepID=UPI0033205428